MSLTSSRAGSLPIRSPAKYEAERPNSAICAHRPTSLARPLVCFTCDWSRSGTGTLGEVGALIWERAGTNISCYWTDEAHIRSAYASRTLPQTLHGGWDNIRYFVHFRAGHRSHTHFAKSEPVFQTGSGSSFE